MIKKCKCHLNKLRIVTESCSIINRRINYNSLLQRRESLFEITDGKIAAFVSNEDKMYAYVQHEL
jgi:hypothetical protein